ncbi:Type I secretion membrane fusion protein, HlyD family [hydrothermal vent metagenome]|uniref:Type I secretion membrane fusion protein, HlyD family n=1 Tax=hydrothermal vent metagenome TaxID=652676 RepID=A0A3B0TC02_9ZZZZ
MDNKKQFQNHFWILLGVLTILAVFGGGGAWAAFSKISGAIIAPGSISVESKIKTVQHLEGGIVAQIYVRNGDRVKAGDPLIRLDDTALRARLNITSNNLLELVARRARLEAELEGRDSIEFPKEILDKADMAITRNIMASKRALFEARKQTRLGQKGMMEQKIIQLDKQIQGLKAQMQSKTNQADILMNNIERKQEAATNGLISQDNMDQLRRQHLQLVGEAGELTSNIARIGSTITQTRLQIIQIDIDLRESAQKELREVSGKITELREQETALKDTLRRTLIVSPVSGRVLNLAIFTVGGVVSPAKPIVQIIPDNDRLIIEARVKVTDVDQVFVGQQASVVLSAFNTRTTPNLMARVINISAARLVDSSTNVPYFSVEIEIPESELARLNPNQKLLPGMPAEVYIRTGERTPLDYLFKPLANQIMRAFKEQ